MKYKKMILMQMLIIIIILMLLIIAKSSFVQYIPNCYINKNFGLLCPSCGGTRCIINIFNGNIKEAFFYHPIFFITFIYLAAVDIIYIINIFKKNKIFLWIYPKPYYAIIWAVILVVYTIIRNVLIFV